MKRVAILGASGYTGAELVRLLTRHGGVEIAALTADRQAGKLLADVFPQFAVLELPILSRIEDTGWSDIDMVFAALPHGLTQEVLAGLPNHLRIVDLSADFRLRDPTQYQQWYGHEHRALKLQAEAVYGLTEFARDRVKSARLVANPGCYPTVAQLPLIPLLEACAIDPADIVVDAKSGVTGAGRDARLGSLYAEIAEGLHAYGVGNHRHGPEIEQGLSDTAGRAVEIAFTPHLAPMNRGMLATIYVRLLKPLQEARQILADRFAGEPFVTLLPEGASPATRHVRGSNHCQMNIFPDRRARHAIVVSAIDNLVKGASGQAVQNMNVMLGFPEVQGLLQEALFP